MQQPSLDQSLQFSLCWGLSCLRSCSLLTCFRSNRQIKSPVPVLPNDAKHLRLDVSSSRTLDARISLPLIQVCLVSDFTVQCFLWGRVKTDKISGEYWTVVRFSRVCTSEGIGLFCVARR